MPTHPASLDEAQLLKDCTTATNRRGGPGGQHRNKVETAVVITHTPTGIVAEANERRSQEANRQQAITRLRLRLATDFRQPAGPPSELWQRRRSGTRIVVSDSHTDFPSLLAEALDHLQQVEFDTAAAAGKLQVSATQLVNLVRKLPAAFELLNRERTERSLRPLK